DVLIVFFAQFLDINPRNGVGFSRVVCRDSVQLETSVNTISYEYLLDFTSEYGISEALHPELPGPGDRIVDFPEDERVIPTAVDWRTNASKDGIPANGTYSVEDVRALDTHRTPIQKQPEMLLCMVGQVADTIWGTSLIRAPNPTKGDRCSRDAAARGRTHYYCPGTDQAVETVTVEPPTVRESRKRGHEGTDCKTHMKNTINLKFSFTIVSQDVMNIVQKESVVDTSISKLSLNDVISKVVCVMCKKCLISINYDKYLRSYVNGKIPRGGKIVDYSESKSTSDCSNGDNACTSNTMEPKIKRFPNSTSLLGRLSRFVCGTSTQVLVIFSGEIFRSPGFISLKDWIKIMETMNVSFNELLAMAFEQGSSNPGLQSMTSGQIISELGLTYAPSTITKQQPTEDERVFLTAIDWRTNASKDGMPTNGTYSVEDVRALDTYRTPIQKQPEMLLYMLEISRRYYLGDEVYPTFHYDDDRGGNGPVSLIRAPNPTKVNTWSRPRAPHEVRLLTLTTPRVIEMDEPAVATDSSGVPSTIERSPLDFAHEAEASGRGTAAPEMPPPEDVPVTTAPGTDQAVETVAVEPPTVRESHKRGHEGTDANAPPKSLRRDHADRRPSGSSRGGKSLADMQLCLASNVAMGSQLHLRFDQEAKLLRKSVAQVARRDQRIQARESEIKNLKALLETEASMKRAAEEKSIGLSQELERMRAQFSKLQVINERLSQQVDALQHQVSGEETLKAAFEDYKRQQDQLVEQRCAEIDARLDALSIDFDEELYPHMLTAIVGRRWVIGHRQRLAIMKCAESLEKRQAFADVVSAGVAKGMSEGLKHGVEHGHAQLTVESLEAYDPEAEAKFAAALQSLKDLKFPMLDQLEGLKDAPMDVIIAELYLESDTGEDAPQFIRDLRPSSSQLAISVYLNVRDPRNPWGYKEEIKLSDAIAANISRAEKNKKCRIVCRTHGVGSAHHARSDGVLVSVPTVVPQGLALLLVDADTQTDLEDA
nr:hypothetical protein [Tanacetum cinerariifolium]